jgi:hypothetical protein
MRGVDRKLKIKIAVCHLVVLTAAVVMNKNKLRTKPYIHSRQNENAAILRETDNEYSNIKAFDSID